jgi:hypothetical protein
MKPKSLITAVSFLFFSISVFGQYKYTQKLGNLATIMLPDTPKLIRTKEGTEFYMSRYKGVIFMAQRGDIGGGLRDLFRKSNTDTIYNEYIHGLLKGTNGKLFYKNKIKVQEHEALDFGYKAELNGQETYRYNRIVTLNDTILMCGIWSSDSVAKDSPALDDFFIGFKTKSDHELKLDNATNLGRKTGRVIGILVVLLIPIAVGLGLVFLIRKIVYKNKR